MTVTQLHGIYVQPDTYHVVAFDNVRVEELSHSGNTLKSRPVNPAKYVADVSGFVKSSQAAKRAVGSFVLKPVPIIHLDARASTIIHLMNILFNEQIIQ